MIPPKIAFNIILAFFFLSDCSSTENEYDFYEISGNTMGTFYTVKIVKRDIKLTDDNYEKIKPGMENLLDEINRQMSTYIDDSEISLFNRSNDTGWFPVSANFAEVVGEAINISKISKGAFDITVGPLVNLWGFGPEDKTYSIPGDNEIENVMGLIGYKNLTVRLSPPAIKKRIGSIYCDLSAIAKGFGVDKLAEYLDSDGITNYMVEIGGEIKTKGVNHLGNIWQIGISIPDDNYGIHKVTSLNNTSIATSGDYRNYFEENGIRYSHTIDPRTGKPITHKLVSVSVVHNSCMIADAMATVINVLGPEEGFDFAVDEELPVFMIVKENNKFIEKSTQQFEKLLSTMN